MSAEIILNFDQIRIRPSSVGNFYGFCSHQWGKVFLEGVVTIPGVRAAMGTAIHKGAEVMWTEAIAKKQVDANVNMMKDAVIENFQEAVKKGVKFVGTDTQQTAEKSILDGTEAFVSDIVPFVSIPTAVEQFFEVELDHPIVSGIGGTIDYLQAEEGIIDDIKTSKRKSSPADHVVQQSIYKYLAIANKVPVLYNRLQNVVLKAKPEGAILELEPNVDLAKKYVNGILDVLTAFHAGVDPAVLFRCNTGHYLCSTDYCSIHGTDQCPATYKAKTGRTQKPTL